MLPETVMTAGATVAAGGGVAGALGLVAALMLNIMLLWGSRAALARALAGAGQRAVAIRPEGEPNIIRLPVARAAARSGVRPAAARPAPLRLAA